MSLIAIAIAPIILILFYIYRRDKYEKEPLKLLIKAFIFGALTVIPIIFIETWLGDYWDRKYDFPSNQMLTAAYNAFIVAASSEELFKYLAFFILIWKSKDFNEKFDGIVYAVYISLGFAAVENIMYVISHGMGTGILRAFTAVPAHAMFGISMGYFLAWAKFRPQKRIYYLILSLAVPIFLHGFYDFILMSQNTVLLIFFVPFLVAMLIVAFKEMKHLSKTSKFKPTDSE